MNTKRKCTVTWVTPSAYNPMRLLPEEVAAICAVYLADLVVEYRELAMDVACRDFNQNMDYPSTIAQLDARSRALGLDMRQDHE